MRLRAACVERDRLAQRVFGLAKGVLSPGELNRIARAQDEIISLNLFRTLPRRGTGFVVLYGAVRACDLADDLVHDLVLNEEHIGHFAFVAVGPNVRAGIGVVQLCVNAEAIVAALNAAFEDIARAELSTEPAHVYGLTLVLEGHVARDHA